MRSRGDVAGDPEGAPVSVPLTVLPTPAWEAPCVCRPLARSPPPCTPGVTPRVTPRCSRSLAHTGQFGQEAKHKGEGRKLSRTRARRWASPLTLRFVLRPGGRWLSRGPPAVAVVAVGSSQGGRQAGVAMAMGTPSALGRHLGALALKSRSFVQGQWVSCSL